jgi:hypothetical protein
MGGWEKASAYNNLYNAREMDRLKGTIDDVIEAAPMPGMAPAVIIMLRESESDVLKVHLCPVWFADKNSIGVRKGDQVKIKGAWAEINGEDVFMASKVKKGDYFEFKVRLTKDGTPFWTMTPEELVRERASD